SIAGSCRNTDRVGHPGRSERLRRCFQASGAFRVSAALDRGVMRGGHQPKATKSLGAAGYSTTSTLTFATPLPVMPSVSAADADTGTTRPRTNGPGSLTRAVTERPVSTSGTRSRGPNAAVGWGAGQSFWSGVSRLLLRVHWRRLVGVGEEGWKVEGGEGARCCPAVCLSVAAGARCLATALRAPSGAAGRLTLVIMGGGCCAQAASAAAVSPAASNRSATPMPEDETLRGPQPKRCAPLPARQELLMEDILTPPPMSDRYWGWKPWPDDGQIRGRDEISSVCG